MSKFKKVTYCKSCGGPNHWLIEGGSSLPKKPKFCASCGCNLTTGEKRQQKVVAEEEIEKDIEIPANIPPLELDMEASYFPKRDSQSLGHMITPVLKEEE